MTFYSFIVVVHIIAAVAGLGATFAMPVLMSRPKTVTQAKFAHNINGAIEKVAKIGSLSLLGTGLILGALEPSLFTEIWYIASLVIYVAIQPIVAVILPKKGARQMEILENHQGDELPQEYLKIGREIAPLNGIAHVSVFVLIILMSLKPF